MGDRRGRGGRGRWSGVLVATEGLPVPRRRLPPSQRAERIPECVLEYVRLVVDDAAEVKAASESGTMNVNSEALGLVARIAVQGEMFSYRRDSRGVYHVRSKDGDHEVPLPPHGFPRGYTPRPVLLRYIQRARLGIPSDVVEHFDDSRDGCLKLHMLIAMDLLAGDGAVVTASDAEIAYFLGWKEEDLPD